MFDDLKIRNKLILLMAGPIIIVVLLSFLGSRSRSEAADESRNTERFVSSARANSDVVDALQTESLYSSAYVGSDREEWTDEVTEARAATDALLAPALEGLDDLPASGPDVESTAQLAVGAADKLGFYRQSVDQGFRADQYYELVINYSEIQDTFLAVNTAIADELPDAQAAAELREARALGSFKSALAIQASLVAGASEQGSFGSERAYDAFTQARVAEEAELTLLTSLSDAERKGEVRDAQATDEAQIFEAVTSAADQAGTTGSINGDAAAVVSSSSALLAGLHEVEVDLFDQLISDAQSANSSAERASNLFLLAAFAGIATAGVAALLLGRRITGPLGTLTEAADHLSGEQMPRLIESLKNPADDELTYQLNSMRPIEIDSDDEIGRLARSFNEVQRVTGAVATEQAQLLRKGIGDMFVNLARRNQALLDRQIEFIDELERGEEDPDQLDNLYKLDHLATRMRRNAESLLVLAGAEPPRRRGRPAPLANVVRAALAEVEDFGRIELLSFDPVLVASNAAADLAHLLSELMENATNFSPPETSVEVVGHTTNAEGYVISVTDHGIGMSADQIVAANESLARPPLVGLALSRSLGFIVVGRLAARHGISVRMMASAAGGVTAVVSLPPTLVVSAPQDEEISAATPETPARLKPILDSTGPANAPLAFHPDAGDDAQAAPPAPTQLPPPQPFEAAPPPPAPVEEVSSEPVAWLPDAAPDAGAPTEPVSSDGTDTASIAAQVDEAVEPAMPAAISFAAPQDSEPAPEPGEPRLDGPPPPAPPSPNRPFFLEDAEPPRAFGTPAAASAPAAPEPPAPAAPRLFGTQAPEAPPQPAAPAAPTPTVEPSPGGDAPESLPEPVPVASAPTAAPSANGTVTDGPPPPLATRKPAAAAAPTARREPSPPAAPEAPAPQAAPAAPEAPAPQAAPEPEAKTASGLAKRVPRSAGGTRTIPGAETERGVAATRRSPEEIRKMLSQHSAGRQRASVQPPAPADSPEENESND